MIRTAGLLLVLLLSPSPTVAQLPDTLSDVGRLYVLTILPGEDVYNRYGHTAIRAQDRQKGLDVTFNYGTFDFEAPGFIGNFIQGEMDYFLSFGSTRRALQSATLQARAVRQQLLDVSKEHRDAIYSALLKNAEEENREYRYDFLFDNCATRPRDILATALGASVTWDNGTGLQQSFRQLLDPYHAASPDIDLGTDLVLGSRLDREASASEEAFLPIRLEAILAAAEVEDQYGRRPLVLVSDTLIWSPRPVFPERAFPWPTLLTGLLLLAGLLTLKRSLVVGRQLPLFDNALLATLGVVGVVLLYMATATSHVVTGANYNLLWALPTHLAAIFLFKRLGTRKTGVYLVGAAVLAALSLTGGWLLPQPLPMAMVPIVLLAVIRFGSAGILRLRAKEA
ncbi:MAG: hypothetical protein ACI80V_001720 [Rhodothermales bacterium]|jgi:hypothetical protein